MWVVQAGTGRDLCCLGTLRKLADLSFRLRGRAADPQCPAAEPRVALVDTAGQGYDTAET